MQPRTADHDALVAVLDFYVAAGIDLALDETPHDRFAEDASPAVPSLPEPARERPPARQRLSDAPRPALSSAATAPLDQITGDARARAADARTLTELEEIVGAFEGCLLRASAKQLVFADGAPGSRVMFLGEAPGADEDRTGTPFVGRAGQLLDLMMEAIGLDRSTVYIANIVPWRPPGNRTPTPQEVAICLPFALRQIELARPDFLVTVGSPATQAVLGVKDGITRMRGRWVDHTVGRLGLRVLPMLHPAYLLRQPLHKRFAWRDLRALKRALDGSPGLEPAPPVTT